MLNKLNTKALAECFLFLFFVKQLFLSYNSLVERLVVLVPGDDHDVFAVFAAVLQQVGVLGLEAKVFGLVHDHQMQVGLFGVYVLDDFVHFLFARVYVVQFEENVAELE